MITPRFGHGCAFVKGMLYAVGGWTSNKDKGFGYPISRVERLNVSASGGQWAYTEDMIEKRWDHGVAVLDGVLFAVGGQGGKTGDVTLNTVEKYNNTNQKWMSVAPLIKSRARLGVAVLGRLLYALGGLWIENGVSWSSVEVYDAGEDKWDLLPTKSSLPGFFAGRASFGVAVLEQEQDPGLFVLGGVTDDFDTTTVATTIQFERTDEPVRGAGTWRQAASLPSPRSRFGVGVAGDAIYVVGGGDATNCAVCITASVETCHGAACAVAPTPAPSTHAPSPARLPSGDVALIAVSVSAAFLLCAIGVARARRRMRRNEADRTLKERLLEDRLDNLEAELERQDRVITRKDSMIEDAEKELDNLQEGWRIDVSELKLLAFVASGTEGRVFRGTLRGHEVAVKMIQRDPEHPELHGFSNAEVKAMQRLRGTRLVFFYGVGQLVLNDEPELPSVGTDSQATLQKTRAPLPSIRAMDPDCVEDTGKAHDFVVLEYMVGGSLGRLLRRKRAERKRGGDEWPWHDRLRVVRDVAEAVAQMHAKRYIHRDLKPDNILLDADGRCKLADLGLARFDKVLDEIDVINTMHDYSNAAGGGGTPFTAGGGTPAYMAPEVVMKWLTAKGLTELLVQEKGSSASDGGDSVPSSPFASSPACSPPRLKRLRGVIEQIPRRRTLWLTAMHVDRDGGGDTPSNNSSDQTPEYMHARRRSLSSASKRTWHGADCYAFACILWEVFALRPLWAESNGVAKGCLEIWRTIQCGGRPTLLASEIASAPREIGEGYVRLMKALWAQLPEDRPTMDEVVQTLDRIIAENQRNSSNDGDSAYWDSGLLSRSWK